MSKKLVLLFSGSGANDAIRGLMTEYSDALSSVEMSVVHMTFDPAELQYAVGQIAQGNIGFLRFRCLRAADSAHGANLGRGRGKESCATAETG